jgi:hypothetical protein
MMIIKYHYHLGFERLCEEVSDSVSWRRLCRVPLDEVVPHPSTLEKITTCCGLQGGRRLERRPGRQAKAPLTFRGQRVEPDRPARKVGLGEGGNSQRARVRVSTLRERADRRYNVLSRAFTAPRPGLAVLAPLCGAKSVGEMLASRRRRSPSSPPTGGDGEGGDRWHGVVVSEPGRAFTRGRPSTRRSPPLPCRRRGCRGRG